MTVYKIYLLNNNINVKIVQVLLTAETVCVSEQGAIPKQGLNV